MKLSEQAWKESQDTYKALINHKFNQELKEGTLPKEKFAYYIEQDAIYLERLARAFAQIAALSKNTKDIKQFSKFALDSIVIGEEIINKFIKDEFNLKIVGNVSSATLNYVKYLEDLSTAQSIEMIIAAVLPALWVYYEVGSYIARNTVLSNSFYLWIETYSGREFSDSSKYVREVFDSFAEQAEGLIKLQMLEVFRKSASLEKGFLDNIYQHSLA
ncbi:MAG: Aminopyrimidine aminohydrolase [Wolbachia endosymbiont of Ctenocephalides orientis wCori]|nr:MAG: Aminopyrimidine aminohydrolase [Wolbachia endosymbiont of Ctenocephalides orientis wCori]